MAKKSLKYIFLEEGEFLYDQLSFKVYTFLAPHKLVGKITQDFKLETCF